MVVVLALLLAGEGEAEGWASVVVLLVAAVVIPAAEPAEGVETLQLEEVGAQQEL